MTPKVITTNGSASTSRSNSTSSVTPDATASPSSAMTVAMNSFIQELRNLSSTSSASSNSSFDSGFSASFAGDSNVGSGRATAITNAPPPGTIWGNKSLWGVPPLSPAPAKQSSPAAGSSEATGPVNNNSNSMYVSKDSLWNTTSSTAVSPSSQSQSPHGFSPSIWENSGTKATSAVTSESATTSSNVAASSLGSIWMIPEDPTRNVWGDSSAVIAPKAPQSSQLLRPMEIGSGAGSKLSSLWAPNATASDASPAAANMAASGGNVLKSLRLAGTVGAGSGPSSSFGLGGLTTTPAVSSMQQLFSDEFLSYLNINN